MIFVSSMRSMSNKTYDRFLRSLSFSSPYSVFYLHRYPIVRYVAHFLMSSRRNFQNRWAFAIADPIVAHSLSLSERNQASRYWLCCCYCTHSNRERLTANTMICILIRFWTTFWTLIYGSNQKQFYQEYST